MNEILFWFLIIIISIWEIVWKGFSLWKSAQNRQKYWFISILLLNTLGILPIVYLKFFQKRDS